MNTRSKYKNQNTKYKYNDGSGWIQIVLQCQNTNTNTNVAKYKQWWRQGGKSLIKKLKVSQPGCNCWLLIVDWEMCPNTNTNSKYKYKYKWMCPNQVAQLYSVAEASKNETGGGEGVEVPIAIFFSWKHSIIQKKYMNTHKCTNTHVHKYTNIQVHRCWRMSHTKMCLCSMGSSPRASTHTRSTISPAR